MPAENKWHMQAGPRSGAWLSPPCGPGSRLSSIGLQGVKPRFTTSDNFPSALTEVSWAFIVSGNGFGNFKPRLSTCQQWMQLERAVLNEHWCWQRHDYPPKIHSTTHDFLQQTLRPVSFVIFEPCRRLITPCLMPHFKLPLLLDSIWQEDTHLENGAFQAQLSGSCWSTHNPSCTPWVLLTQKHHSHGYTPKPTINRHFFPPPNKVIAKEYTIWLCSV